MNEIKHQDLAKLVGEIKQIARLAGDKILEIYETDFSCRNKKDNSPLTATAAQCIVEESGAIAVDTNFQHA